METLKEFYLITLLVASFIAITVSYLAWKRRPAKMAATLTVLMMSISVWTLFQSLVFIFHNIYLKVIMANLRYIGIELAPIAFYILACEYKDQDQNYNLKSWIRCLTPY